MLRINVEFNTSIPAETLLYTIAREYYNMSDVDSAFHLFKFLAERGYADAQNDLGFMYVNGIGVEQDYEEAAKWLLMADDNHSEEAFDNLRLLAENGHPRAQVNLGLAYLNRAGTDIDHENALKWFRKAANLGYAEGKFHLGTLYTQGLGVTQNFTKGMALLSEAAAQDGEVSKAVVQYLQNDILFQGVVSLTKQQRAKVDFLLASLGVSETQAVSAMPSSAPSGPEPTP